MLINMKYNVGLLYLKVNNLSDVVIYDTVKYMVRDILDRKNIDYKIKGIDIGDNFLDTIFIKIICQIKCNSLIKIHQSESVK